MFKMKLHLPYKDKFKQDTVKTTSDPKTCRTFIGRLSFSMFSISFIQVGEAGSHLEDSLQWSEMKLSCHQKINNRSSHHITALMLIASTPQECDTAKANLCETQPQRSGTC